MFHQSAPEVLLCTNASVHHHCSLSYCFVGNIKNVIILKLLKFSVHDFYQRVHIVIS